MKIKTLKTLSDIINWRKSLAFFNDLMYLFVTITEQGDGVFVQLAPKTQNCTVYFAMPQSEYWLDPSVILSSVIPAHLSGSLPIYIWA